MVSQTIRTGGAVISEYIPGCPAVNWRFVQRNRLIAALSPATVVMQAPSGSGALITAEFAVDYDRDVMFHACAFCAETGEQSIGRVLEFGGCAAALCALLPLLETVLGFVRPYLGG